MPNADAPSHLPPAPVGALCASVAAVCVLVFIAAAGLMVMNSAGGTLTGSDLTTIGLGAGCALVPGLAAVFALRWLANWPGVNIASVCLAFSGLRLMGTIACAILVVSIIEPDRRPFVNTLLLAAGAVLVLETMILRRWASLEAPATGRPGATEVSS